MIIGAKLFWAGPLTSGDLVSIGKLFGGSEVRIVSVNEASASNMEIEVAVVTEAAQ